jgi:hypothetical protein
MILLSFGYFVHIFTQKLEEEYYVYFLTQNISFGTPGRPGWQLLGSASERLKMFARDIKVFFLLTMQ